MALSATYVDSDTFTISGDHTGWLTEDRRVKADCGADGIKYTEIESTSYSDPDTTVNVKTANLTSNLTEVEFGVVASGDAAALPLHDHTGRNQGGLVASSVASVDYGTDETTSRPSADGQVLWRGEVGNAGYPDNAQVGDMVIDMTPWS